MLLYVHHRTICVLYGAHKPLLALRRRRSHVHSTRRNDAELELEHAELLPSRKTLWVSKCHPSCGPSNSFTQVGYGNTAQADLIDVALGNGSLDNILSLGSGNIL